MTSKLHSAIYYPCGIFSLLIFFLAYSIPENKKMNHPKHIFLMDREEGYRTREEGGFHHMGDMGCVVSYVEKFNLGRP